MIRPFRTFGRWMFDYRTGAMVAASLLAAAVIGMVILSGLATRDALHARQATAEAATRRIDRLQDEIHDLGEQLTADARANGHRIGELTDQIAVLQEQVRQLGGTPIVVQAPRSSRSTPPTTAPRPTTTTAPKPQPAPTTTTTPPRRGCVLVVCIGGKP